VRQKRIQEQIKVKIPLPLLTIIHKDKSIINGLKEIEGHLLAELNVKKIEYRTDESNFIKLYALPNSPILGKRLGKDFPKFNKLIRNLTTDELYNFETITILDQTFSKDDIFMYREALKDSGVLSSKNISIILDTSLTKDLLDEGQAREIVSHIQKLRKNMDLNVSDRIKIIYQGDPLLYQVIQKHKEYIKRETLSISIESSEIVQTVKLSVDQIEFSLTITR
jgi:isoleucyl-tRNA synthetase